MKEDKPKPDDSDITTFGVCMVLFVVGSFIVCIILIILAMFGVMLW